MRCGASSRPGPATKLLHITGIAEIGPPDGEVWLATLAASRLHGLPHEIMDAAGPCGAFRRTKSRPIHVGVFQPDGGSSRSSPAIAAILARRGRRRTEIRDAAVSAGPVGQYGGRPWRPTRRYRCAVSRVAAGPWIKQLLRIYPRASRHRPRSWPGSSRSSGTVRRPALPGVLLESRHGRHYGFPRLRRRCQGRQLTSDETVDPDIRSRVSAADETLHPRRARRHIPAANGPAVAAQTCLYTVTPLTAISSSTGLPGAANIIVASPSLRPRLQILSGDRRNPAVLATKAGPGTTFHVSNWRDLVDPFFLLRAFWNGQDVSPAPSLIIWPRGDIGGIYKRREFLKASAAFAAAIGGRGSAASRSQPAAAHRSAPSGRVSIRVLIDGAYNLRA